MMLLVDVLYSQGTWQPKLDKMPDVSFKEAIAKQEKDLNYGYHRRVLIDYLGWRIRWKGVSESTAIITLWKTGITE